MSNYQPTPPLSIIIIEDNGDQAFVLTDYINRAARQRGATAYVTVHSRLSALLDWVRQNPSRRPAIAFIDIQMPRMTGMEFLTQMRAEPMLADTRAIAYTANVHPVQQQQYVNAGFAGLIGKPFDPNTIDATLHAIIFDRQPIWVDNRL